MATSPICFGQPWDWRAGPREAARSYPVKNLLPWRTKFWELDVTGLVHQVSWWGRTEVSWLDAVFSCCPHKECIQGLRLICLVEADSQEVKSLVHAALWAPGAMYLLSFIQFWNWPQRPKVVLQGWSKVVHNPLLMPPPLKACGLHSDPTASLHKRVCPHTSWWIYFPGREHLFHTWIIHHFNCFQKTQLTGPWGNLLPVPHSWNVPEGGCFWKTCILELSLAWGKEFVTPLRMELEWILFWQA